MSSEQDTKANLDDVKTDVFNKVTGPRGVLALLAAAKKKKGFLENELEALKQRSHFVKGQIGATDDMITSLEMLAKECGIDGIATIATGVAEEPVAQEQVVFVDKEIEEHKAKGKCLFTHFVMGADGRKRKFCQRKGSKKYEGYCKIHWDRVNGGKEN